MNAQLNDLLARADKVMFKTDARGSYLYSKRIKCLNKLSLG